MTNPSEATTRECQRCKGGRRKQKCIACGGTGEYQLVPVSSVAESLEERLSNIYFQWFEGDATGLCDWKNEYPGDGKMENRVAEVIDEELKKEFDRGYKQGARHASES